MNTVTYHIPNISCNHCAHTIKMELGEMEGVESVDVQVEEKNASISYDSPATEEKIVELLAEINFPPQS